MLEEGAREAGGGKRESESHYDRRRFIGTTAMAIVGAQLETFGPGSARAGDKPVKASMNSFDPIKQINAGVLNVGYAESGPPNGPPVILLHGWPYDIHAFVDVAPLLAAKGYRVIVPYLRGYGSTTFLSADTVRNGQQSALGERLSDRQPGGWTTAVATRG